MGTTIFRRNRETWDLETTVRYGKREYRVVVREDIAAHGGYHGPGTNVMVYTDVGPRGYQGP